jgi:predicted unusual protein kinase regulating ubiquinone biosynthesis (AarF/ABC1/UbiB family)
LAALGAQTGANLLANKNAAAAAASAAQVLGNLRGLAAKVGQMASYVDGAVPEAYREAYETALKSLRTSTQSSPAEAIRKAVEEDLLAPIEDLFAEWEAEPFASASIGQVHRARLDDGRWVAVKVQHPGIDRAVESDLRNAGMLQAMLGLMLPRTVDTKRVFDEVRERFREELDYHREAENHRRFARIHAGDPNIVIPEVIEARSGHRVIATELVSGITLEQAAALSDTERKHYATTLWRFEFKGLLQHGLFNADPHPGNFLFQPENRIAFLDFGCVQYLDDSMRLASNHLHEAAVQRDELAFAQAVAHMLRTRGGSFERAVVAYVRRCFQPIFESPFRITPQYVRSDVSGVRPLKSELFAKDKSFVMPPPGWAFMNRLQFGFFSVLSKLDVEIDYAEIEREILRP